MQTEPTEECGAGERRALIVVDVQNDFCPGGSLAVPHGDEVVEPLNRRIREFLDRGDVVVKTRDWHPAVTTHFAIYGGQWPVHCVQNTRGAEFHPDLIDDPRIKLISKDKPNADEYSAFDHTNLAAMLLDENLEEVWIGGLATDYCVKHTALAAIREGFRVTVLRDAIRAVELSPGDGDRAIVEMQAAGAAIEG